MTALASLSKFQGRYDRWLYIRQCYNLKWSSGNNSLQALQRFFNTNLTLESMLQKVRNMIEHLPVGMPAVIKFAVLTGLRPSEAIESVRLINGSSRQPVASYYNEEQQTLEHFRFPDIFLRTTKKAYLSYLSIDNYHYFANLGCKIPTWNAIRMACQRRNIKMDMHLCRKVFASFLRKEGIQPEVIDLLQGRCSQSVLVRHYLAPSQSLRENVLSALEKLQSQLQ